ncbi:MAG: DUF1266 domain-containing protein [Marinomonas sp.]
MPSQNDPSAVMPTRVDLSPAQQQWLLSLSGYLSMQNGFSLDELTHHHKNFTDEQIAEGNVSILKDAYGVTTKEELINSLQFFCDTPQNQAFIKCLADFTTMDFYGIERKYEESKGTPYEAITGWAKTHARSLSMFGIKAFDIGRYAFLCRCGVTVGLLTEAEAWGYLAHIGSIAQSLFSSWTDFATSYLVGRSMWQKMLLPESFVDIDVVFDFRYGFYKSMEQTTTGLQGIFADEEHPWCQLDWKMTF